MKGAFLFAVFAAVLTLQGFAHAAWHWELVNGEFQSDVTYDKFVEFNNELYKISSVPDMVYVSKTLNGLEWTLVDSSPEFGNGIILNAFEYKNLLWVFLLSEIPDVSFQFWYSQDGTQWQLSSNITQIYPHPFTSAVIYNNFIWALSYIEGTPFGEFSILKSEDGIVWEIVTENTPMESYQNGSSLSVFQDKLILALGFGAGPYWTSNDGVNWDFLSAGYTQEYAGFSIFRDTIFLLGGAECSRECFSFNTIFYSTDGQSWKEYDCGSWWSERSGFSLATYNDELWLFGGYNNFVGPTDDIWRFVPGPAPSGGEGEGSSETYHTADTNPDGSIDLTELLALIQIYNTLAYHCDEFCGYELGYGALDCTPHSSDYNPADGVISLSELLRMVQLYNFGSYHFCPGLSEDDFCPGTP